MPPNGGKILVLFAPVMISKPGVQPITDLSNTEETLLGKWWKRPCIIATTSEGRTIHFSRRDIILTLADKEGGTHVDEKLREDYRRYIVNADITTFSSTLEIGTVQQARFIAAESASHMIDFLKRIIPGACWIRPHFILPRPTVPQPYAFTSAPSLDYSRVTQWKPRMPRKHSFKVVS